MATLEEQRRLQQQAQDYWRQMKNLLVQQTQPGNPRAFAQGIDRDKLHNRSPFFNRGGMEGFSLPAGRMPSDADVTKFIEFMGGNPYTKQLQRVQADPGSPTKHSPGGPDYNGNSMARLPAPDQLIQRMIASNQAALDRANLFNEARYAEGHGELSGLRDRNQERVQNWGVAATEDLNERMEEALDRQIAMLGASGIANSNVIPAFQQRNARDTAREAQRISEMRDARASEYDTRDTGNLVGFVERREDTGPDPNALLQMVMNYNLENAKLAAQQQNAAEMQKALESRGTGGRVSPVASPGPRGGVMPMFMGPNPAQLAGMMFGGMRGPQQAPPVDSQAVLGDMARGNAAVKSHLEDMERRHAESVAWWERRRRERQQNQDPGYVVDKKRNQSRRPVPALGPALPTLAFMQGIR